VPASRARALRPYLLVALVPALVVLWRDGRLGALLAVMWVVLVGTIAVAATSDRPQKANTDDPRGRLFGQ
jgi:hypothetical protein